MVYWDEEFLVWIQHGMKVAVEALGDPIVEALLRHCLVLDAAWVLWFGERDVGDVL